MPNRPGLVTIRVKEQFRPAARGATTQKSVDVAADDIVEVELADGMCLWMRGDEYRERFGGALDRDASGVELTVPANMPPLRTSPARAGVAGWAVKSLKVLGIDLHQRTALALAEKIETRKRLRRDGLGIFRYPAETGAFAPRPVRLPARAADDRPYLVLLHGTLSSTWGSFGELWSNERRRELATLQDVYGDRILGFEHQTMAVSPIRNAIDLAEALPQSATIHVISHSRGGLVGELLCRGGATRTADAEGSGQPAAGQPFSQGELEALGDQKPLLEELAATLQERRITVARFARVACPAFGTTLASRRLDRWLSLIGSVASRALPGSPITDVASDSGEFIAAVIKERTRPETFPGIEAMMPESPFARVINWPERKVGGDLFVIAGDLDPEGVWTRLAVWVTDRFYDGDHDLVVNTDSMGGGAARVGAARQRFFAGPAVNHFNYFRNADSAEALVNAVARGETSGFDPLVPRIVTLARGVIARDSTPRPTVFVLPGIMGSELAIKQRAIWLKLLQMFRGGMGRLSIDAQGVHAFAPMANAYGDLIEHLAGSHRVIPFPYDWRIDPRMEADRLARRITQELPAAKLAKLPIRILAHSMGGLVSRAMIARHPSVWSDMLSIPGSRLVMLGAPNGGSHAITELLVSRSKTLRQLALIDAHNGEAGLQRIIARFPGVLAMLPKDDREDYFAPATWEAYSRASGGGWTLPAAADLRAAQEFRTLLDGAGFDPAAMVYVAGSAPATVCGMRLDPSARTPVDRIRFEGTTRGDGRVPWDTGIPLQVPTWYMRATHGDMAADEDSFPAITDLLATGSTSRLAKSPPVPRGAAEVFTLSRDTDAIYPDEEALEAAALGGTRRRRARRAQRTVVRVRALHGDLRFASHPVAVGHYSGDTIISAEKALDRGLGGQLSRRVQLGLYPGPIDTSAVFMNERLRDNPRAVPQGALVVGLGTAGAVRAAQITRTVTRGLLDYVTDWAVFAPPRTRARPNDFGISPLLIGSSIGGVGVADSVLACLNAVDNANRILATSGQPQRITEVEFVELWEDRAIQTLDAFQRILDYEPTLRESCEFDMELRRRKGAQTRERFSESSGWWQRIQILGEESDDPSRKALRFSALSGNALNQVRLLGTQRALIDGFVREAISRTDHDQTVSRTLFELLLPNEFKDASLDAGDVVLLLDDESAPYPWELLEDPLDRRSGLERRPYICRHGLLRQLHSLEFREQVQPSVSNDAFVLGDPKSSLVELQGAQAEAREVARELEVNGKFRVNHLDRPEGREVLEQLFDRPYRILHLAGHGVFDHPPDAPPKRRVTGMVIGDGLYLTPHEVRQMRRVPELVFINCCHLGSAVQPAAVSNRHDQYNRLAANVAQEFIRMGVRAVIAAGWAVSDVAASEFARTFYACMLAGATYGRATSEARREIYERFPNVNTWGAYQCYGDPDYRLVPEGARGAADGDPGYRTTGMAITAIHNVTARLATAADGDVDGLIEELQAIETWLTTKKWIGEAGVRLALGKAYWEALHFDEAIALYRAALLEDSSSVTRSDVQQLANQLARWAVHRRAPGQKPMSRAYEDELFAGAESLLSWVTTTLQRYVPEEEGARRPAGEAAENAERQALLASLHKRRAWISRDDRTRRKAVAEMQRGYVEALRSAGGEAYYPLLNAIGAELVAFWVGASRGVARKRMREELDRAVNRLASERGGSADYWRETYLIDGKLLRHLVNGGLGPEVVTELAAEYLDARTVLSRRDFASVVDQVEFLRTMAEQSRKGRTLAKPLGMLVHALTATAEAQGAA
ncbi:MAG TPA: CHAT domain-containing protein [Steroidobacteraceae bacterium]|nr:CHAT domain-containing protein [Steroidobacteraceae bacterium]